MKDELVNSIQSLCISNHWTLSVAESCTGGAIAARLTRVSGCSQYFLGSIVAYSNDLKIKLLGIDPQDLDTHGAVSQVIVEKMARGVMQLTGSDYSLAVTGIAGPEGGSSEKPVGTVLAAIAGHRGDLVVLELKLSGSRHEIIEETENILLTQLRSFLQPFS